MFLWLDSGAKRGKSVYLQRNVTYRADQSPIVSLMAWTPGYYFSSTLSLNLKTTRNDSSIKEWFQLTFGPFRPVIPRDPRLPIGPYKKRSTLIKKFVESGKILQNLVRFQSDILYSTSGRDFIYWCVKNFVLYSCTFLHVLTEISRTNPLPHLFQAWFFPTFQSLVYLCTYHFSLFPHGSHKSSLSHWSLNTKNHPKVWQQKH